MLEAARELFRAVHEGKWLSVTYKNGKNEVTRYWIAVKDIDPARKQITVTGFHLQQHTTMELVMYIGRIQTAAVLEGTVCEINEKLVDDIRTDPEKYASIFRIPVNMRILDYLAACSRLDATPYTDEYRLVSQLDDSGPEAGGFTLNQEQFAAIVGDFQRKSARKYNKLKMQEIGMNMLGVQTSKGMYLLAYKPLRLDVVRRTLVFSDEIQVCREFTVSGYRESIRYFLDEDEMYLLDDIGSNIEEVRDRITRKGYTVDDMPYVLAVGRDRFVDLENEYAGILKMYEDDSVTMPVRAFFGELTSYAKSRKYYSFKLADEQINMDQLLAMDHALRMPLAYVQGPPGTGKTKTIVNTIITAFVYERTLLFASNNNHPIDGVIQQLKSLKYKDREIPFPAARLGNMDEITATLDELKELYLKVRKLKIPPKKKRILKARREKAKKLNRYLQEYDRFLDLQERKEALETLMESNDQLNFRISLEAGQLPEIEKQMKKMEDLRVEDALEYIDDDHDSLMQFLWRSSLVHLQKLNEERFEELRNILLSESEERTADFTRYLSRQDCFLQFLEVCPVVATTSASAYKLGEPVPSFDMVIIDEASQCSTAVSLTAVLRGRNLMLVGDPQQLSPVVQISAEDNEILKNRYKITPEYDYIENSLYKTFLACDAVSDEVLLRYHYRCDPKIIEFSNAKYYNRQLKILSEKAENALQYINIPDNRSLEKNTAPAEIREVCTYIRSHPYENIGVITPFVAQRRLLQEEMKTFGNAECGTVHAFQGDEKDVIIFSLALTDRTGKETYNWLKNNRELINVAVSRAKKKLIVVSSDRQLSRLHEPDDDDLYELVQYVKTNGECKVSAYPAASRAFGIRPYSTKTEEAFLVSLNHALETAFRDGSHFTIHREVPVSHVFLDDLSAQDYFFRGRFDFVVCQKQGDTEMPVLAVELDGMEHVDQEVVQARDRKKEQICRDHGFSLIRVENTYARRYHYIKDILMRYFAGR